MEKTGKRGSLAAALPYLVLAMAIAVSAYAIFALGPHNLDADSASEMLLAELQNREGTLLTDSWYYSSELRTVSPVPLLQLGLLIFPNDWAMARALASLLMLLGAAASALYFGHAARLGAAGVYAAAILAMPFSQTYAFSAFFNGGYYCVYLMLTPVILGLVLSLSRGRVGVKLTLIALLSLWGGTAGVRMMLFLALPLAMALGLELALAMRASERLADALSGEVRMPLLGALLACAMTAAGYLINALILAGKYDFADYGGIAMSMPSSELFFAQMAGIAEFFGVRASGALVGVRGAASLLSLLAMGACGYALIVMIGRCRRGELGFANRVILRFGAASLLLGVAVNVVTEQYYVRYYLPALMLLIVLLMMCWSGTPCRSRLLASAVPLCLCGVFALSSLVYVRQELRADKAPYEQAADWLAENGYTQGYATFWNGATLTEASDGAITVYTLPDPYWQDDWKNLTLNAFLQEKAHFELTPGDIGGPVFVLLSGVELEAQDVPFMDEAHLAHACDAGNIYIYDSAQALYDTLAAQ